MGATLHSKSYRNFGGKEQLPEPQVREFREFGNASLRGITVRTSASSRQQRSDWGLRVTQNACFFTLNACQATFISDIL